MSKIKVGDKVQLKSEEIYKWRRIWVVTHITEDGMHYLKRTITRKGVTFNFIEQAKADELELLKR